MLLLVCFACDCARAVALYRDESALRLRVRPLQAGTFFVTVCVELERGASAAPPPPPALKAKPNGTVAVAPAEATQKTEVLNYRVCKLRVDAPRVQPERASFPLQCDDSEELGLTRHARAVGLRVEPLCPYVHSRDGIVALSY